MLLYLRPTDADVSMNGQRHGEPYRGRVEDGRQMVGQRRIEGAPAIRDPVEIAAHRVEVDETRQRAESRQGVADGKRCQEHVGGRAHRWTPEQHKTDKGVCDDREKDDRRRDDPVNRHRIGRVAYKHRHHWNLGQRQVAAVVIAFNVPAADGAGWWRRTDGRGHRRSIHVRHWLIGRWRRGSDRPVDGSENAVRWQRRHGSIGFERPNKAATES
jgi:hypothetical protein